jgi:hypothetical protein
MSKKEKLLRRFQSRPTDFTWDELVSLLNGFNFKLDNSSGSSHCCFALNTDPSKIIRTCRPHPTPVLKLYQIKAIIKFLEEEELIP